MNCMYCNKEALFIGNTMKCSHCFKDNAIYKRREYFRICYTCYDLKKVTGYSKTKPRECKSCSIKKINRKKPGEYKRYKSVCPGCGAVRMKKARTKTDYCKQCIKYVQKPRQLLYRVCVTCGDKKPVHTKLHASFKQCWECANSNRVAPDRTLAPGEKKTPKKYKKTYTPVGIDGQNKVRITPKKKKKKVEAKTEEQMIKEWLKKNKVTKIEPLSKKDL